MAAGANPQRPLWASTGVKNPDYRDTMYVVDLVVPNTVNTMPEKTLEAVADHGEISGDQVHPHYDDAAAVFAALEDAGIDYDDVIDVLIREGVEKFVTAFDDLSATVEKAMRSGRRGPVTGAGSGSPVDPTRTPSWARLTELARRLRAGPAAPGSPTTRRGPSASPSTPPTCTWTCPRACSTTTCSRRCSRWPTRSALAARRDAMFRGERINVTEDRAVLHTALRLPADADLEVDGHDVVAGRPRGAAPGLRLRRPGPLRRLDRRHRRSGSGRS